MNSVQHKDEGLNIKRWVTFSGYTKIDNVVSYCKEAFKSKKNSIGKDVVCDIDIQYILVGRLSRLRDEKLDDGIIYIIRSRDGKSYLKYRMFVLGYCLDRINTNGTRDEPFYEYHVVSGRLQTSHSQDASDLSCVLQYQFPRSEAFNNFFQNEGYTQLTPLESSALWVTVPLNVDGENRAVWDQSSNSLVVGDLNSHYEIVEEQYF